MNRRGKNMAILLVNIEDRASIALNEFFDYNGHCYALSNRRNNSEGVAISFNDFYDSTVATDKMSDVTVVFCEKQEDKIYVLGWYENAEIYSKSKQVSLFLRGNIIANSADVVRLNSPKYLEGLSGSFMFKNYNVIEMEDSRYDILTKLVYSFDKKANAFVRYPYIHVELDPRAKRNYYVSIKYCESIASAIMSDRCQSLAEIKALYMYANEAMQADKSLADGYYYFAMACYQLGFTKEGIKAVEKALKIEPKAADITALKANILISMGHYEAAAELYGAAAKLDAENENDYLELEKRALDIKYQNSFYSGF